MFLIIEYNLDPTGSPQFTQNHAAMLERDREKQQQRLTASQLPGLGPPPPQQMQQQGQQQRGGNQRASPHPASAMYPSGHPAGAQQQQRDWKVG